MSSLRTVTLQLLVSRPRNLKLSQIAEDTGLSYWFLQNFHYGRIKSPDVDNVQTLYEYLSGKKLIS